MSPSRTWDAAGRTREAASHPRHVLRKIYDSKTDGTAQLTAHTSFADPTSPPDAPPRRSIEVRTLVFWNEALSEPKAAAG